MANTDVLLVTATGIESRTVLEVFEEAIGQKARARQIEDRTYFDVGVISGVHILLVQCEMGSGGLGASQNTVQKGIDSLSPGSVVMVGIAFGLDERKHAIGDILVSENLRPYELQRVGSQVLLRGDRPHASPRLISRLKSASLTWAGAPVHFGVLLSGDKLVDNEDFRETIRTFEPEAIGGEMEGAGLYVACQDKKTDWILVKSICDWADGHKSQDKNDRQTMAATNAAKFLLHALEFAPFESEAHSKGALPLYSSLPIQPFFFGRERELAEIAGAILPESRTWGVLIDGPGGIGKTALAIRAGHLAPAMDFSRKIFMSGKVRELTPAGKQALDDFMLPNFMALLTELANELGDAELRSVPENERANSVRRALAGHHALIVIDNVETFPEPERIRLYQFLSRLPQGCKAIVTSRRRNDVEARIIRLDRMEQKDALALLSELATSNRHLAAAKEEWQTLYETTGGNPLLLRWTSRQLGRRASQCRTVREACDYLRNAPVENDPLEYIFGDLLDTFSDSETASLAALTHFTEPAKIAWVVGGTALPFRQVQTALEDLSDRSLLVDIPEADAYFLPPLAAKFLRDKCAQLVTQTGDRLADRAYALAVENGYLQFERFPAIEAEWPVLSATLPRFVQREDSRLQTLGDALWRFLEFSGRWDESLWLHQQAEEKALAANDFLNAGWQAYRLGLTYHRRNQAAETMACAVRADRHWKAAKATSDTAVHAIRLRGMAYSLAKEYPAAIADLREALELYRIPAPESKAVASTLNDLANIERASGNRDAAERHYREALRIADAINDQESIATYAGSLATLALMQKRWSEAEQLACDTLLLAKALGRQELVAYYSCVLARALARQGRSAEGLPYAYRSVELFKRLRQPNNLEWAQTTLWDCEGTHLIKGLGDGAIADECKNS
jgi:nucleoside phosphorylase/tetratricopeptide (TPR) repeat protein